MKTRIFGFSKLGLLSLTLATIGACAVTPVMRDSIAERLASPVWMLERDIPAGSFALKSYERMHERFAPANIYIEGDGFTTSDFADFNIESNDPTPRNPVALHLATRDKSENVVYLARPCQYSGLLDRTKECHSKYWGNERFSPEVLNAYSTALDEIKHRYDIEGFHLTGYGGGGAIAALLAAGRDDILSLRTVAGNLDHFSYTMHHGLAPLEGSLNPIDFTDKLKNIPQYHFIGAQDPIIPPAILHSYLKNMGESNCVRYQMVQEAEHDAGWVDKWPEFLSRNISCRGPVQDVEFAPLDIPEPIYVPRDTPAKP